MEPAPHRHAKLPGVPESLSPRLCDARAPQQADTQPATTHAKPFVHVRAWPESAHMPPTAQLCSSLAPTHVCKPGGSPLEPPMDRRPMIPRGWGARLPTESGQPPPSGRSRQPGLQPESESSGGEETAGGPVPTGLVHGPAAPLRPQPPVSSPTPTPNRRRAIRVSPAPREARGIRLTPRQPYARVLLGLRGSTRPWEHPSPGKVWAAARPGPAA